MHATNYKIFFYMPATKELVSEFTDCHADISFLHVFTIMAMIIWLLAFRKHFNYNIERNVRVQVCIGHYIVTV
jgi:hypothetical protein